MATVERRRPCRGCGPGRGPDPGAGARRGRRPAAVRGGSGRRRRSATPGSGSAPAAPGWPPTPAWTAGATWSSGRRCGPSGVRWGDGLRELRQGHPGCGRRRRVAAHPGRAGPIFRSGDVVLDNLRQPLPPRQPVDEGMAVNPSTSKGPTPDHVDPLRILRRDRPGLRHPVRGRDRPRPEVHRDQERVGDQHPRPRRRPARHSAADSSPSTVCRSPASARRSARSRSPTTSGRTWSG